MKSIKYFSIIVLSLFIATCQPTTTQEEDIETINQEEMIAVTVDVLYNGIVDADQDALETITADQLIYGHSNGRVQNKVEFITELVDPEALDFVSADLTDQTIDVVGETAIVRHIFSAETSSGGTPGNLSIGVMLVWQNQDGEWKLLARQAYRLPE